MLRRFFLLVAVAILAVDCGGGGSGASGVPSSTKLSDVSAADLTSLCKAHQSQFDDLANPCTGAGFDQSSASACQTAQTACKNDPSMKAGSIDCTSIDVKDVVGCNATVGELEDCLSTLGNYFKTLTCANFMNPPPVPACFNSLQSDCPSLFGGVDMSSSSSSSSSGSAGAGK